MSKIYIETLISEQPEKDGCYIVIKNGRCCYADYSKGLFYPVADDLIYPTHWLRPVDDEEYRRQLLASDSITCPFCGQEDFDDIGLKYHLKMHCDKYDQVPKPYEF